MLTMDHGGGCKCPMLSVYADVLRSEQAQRRSRRKKHRHRGASPFANATATTIGNNTNASLSASQFGCIGEAAALRALERRGVPVPPRRAQRVGPDGEGDATDESWWQKASSGALAFAAAASSCATVNVVGFGAGVDRYANLTAMKGPSYHYYDAKVSVRYRSINGS